MATARPSSQCSRYTNELMRCAHGSAAGLATGRGPDYARNTICRKRLPIRKRDIHGQSASILRLGAGDTVINEWSHARRRVEGSPVKDGDVIVLGLIGGCAASVG